MTKSITIATPIWGELDHYDVDMALLKVTLADIERLEKLYKGLFQVRDQADKVAQENGLRMVANECLLTFPTGIRGWAIGEDDLPASLEENKPEPCEWALVSELDILVDGSLRGVACEAYLRLFGDGSTGLKLSLHKEDIYMDAEWHPGFWTTVKKVMQGKQTELAPAVKRRPRRSKA